MKNSISALALVFVLSFVSGCGVGVKDAPAKDAGRSPSAATAASEKQEKQNEEPVRSAVLVEAFKRDTAEANKRYKDRIVLISGKITDIKDVFGVKALNLRDSDAVAGLQVYLKNAADAGRVRVGDEIVVRGKVRGDGFDIVDDAEIVKVN